MIHVTISYWLKSDVLWQDFHYAQLELLRLICSLSRKDFIYQAIPGTCTYVPNYLHPLIAIVWFQVRMFMPANAYIHRTGNWLLFSWFSIVTIHIQGDITKLIKSQPRQTSTNGRVFYRASQLSHYLKWMIHILCCLLIGKCGGVCQKVSFRQPCSRMVGC